MKKLVAATALIGVLTLSACDAETDPAQVYMPNTVILAATLTCDDGESGYWWFEWVSSGGQWSNGENTPAQSFSCTEDYTGQHHYFISPPSYPGTYKFRVCGFLTGADHYVCADRDGFNGTNYDTFYIPN